MTDTTLSTEQVELPEPIDTADVEVPKQTFAELKVREDIVASLLEAGIEYPFPIQSLTLPVALGGNDIIGQAKTGTGKTLGFGIPALQRVIREGDKGYEKLEFPGAPQALIVAPTRELAIQVGADLAQASKHSNISITTIYGGRPYEEQINALKAGTDVIVGTPGRLIDLNRQRVLNLKQIKTVVLDEADEMLDLGFLPDVERILAALPPLRQAMLFSATMPGAVITMARRYMSRPTHIRATDPGDDDSLTKRNIRQLVYRAHNLDKDEMVARLLQAEGRGKTIIFTQTKRSAAKLTDELIDRGFNAGALHGDLGQGAREQSLKAFRAGKVEILVATDVAARGIDVDDVTHVVNLQCPDDEKTYLHRVGRTGRAGNTGIAVTFVDWDSVPRWSLINKALGLNVPEPVETYSSSPHFFADLDIPKGTKGRLQRAKKTAPAEGDGSPRRDQAERTERTPRRRSTGGRSRTRTVEGEQSGDQGASRHGHSKGKQDRPAREGERHRQTHQHEEQPAAGTDSEQESRARRRPRRRTRSTEGGTQD
ncbi:RNA helicase [Arthrobacter sp. MYb211]|uniref:DEAD/DEAH box helicase n=1 Tax=Micrococcaceae TaxID=1268 RepID=UPI000CFD8D0E|nr:MULTISPECIES: DEAD/DEAH box helicase [unclassified Arthrobacter]PQZ99257.1 RNA helicase [Arthrobacter sp. MYb224]PRA06261.1 RNA helicase [Arthrobacter sp. MYb229]PRA12803.1 RNA helicase [Arthrobacter sp. MYb221]PRB53163.1 RNA helicase [Arthrobacter sp. MYb216]PRC09677.1 RNA helicase [Arthrobacter sp. MYb211]